MRFVVLILGFLTAAHVAIGQAKLSLCEPNMPRYDQWVDKNDFPFTITPQRQQILLHNYETLKRGMTKKEVISTFGTPDFVRDGQKEPNTISCVWAYVFHDPGFGSDARKVLFIGFGNDDSLVLLFPQDVPGLKPVRLQDKSCETGAPNYQNWLAQSSLASGHIYTAPLQRQRQITSEYPKIKLGMTRRQVKDLLGDPDFATTTLVKEENVWDLNSTCAQQYVYVVNQRSDNPTDPSGEGLYLSFDDKGRLFWAFAQNMTDLQPIGSPDWLYEERAKR